MTEPHHDHTLGAPEGARCADHRERQALYTCPRCGGYACALCFHPAVDRCARCIRRDPSEAAPPIAFETRHGNVLSRYLATLGGAFRPTRTAPAFASDAIAPAIWFFCFSALPLVFLSGIVPFTRTLVFGNGVITVLGSPGPLEIAIDVARAIGAQIVLSSIELATLLLPFQSLVRAYAPAGRAPAATRVVLYRFWLAPAAALVGYLAAWFLPMPEGLVTGNAMPEMIEPSLPVLLVALAQATLRVLQIVALSATARLACGLSILLTFVVVLVPLILQILVMPLAATAVDKALPTLPEPPAAIAAPVEITR